MDIIKNTENPRNMSYDELFSLFKHFDESAHKKETLFLGLSLAIVPAVFASWDNLNIFAITLAALASLTFYWLHGIHIARYAHNQAMIRVELIKLRLNFNEVFDVPSNLSIRKIRSRFRWVFTLFWCVLIVVYYLR